MRPTVLVIEEDPDLARLFDAILGVEGYNVQIETGLVGARSALARRTPDVVVYDWSIAHAAGYLWLDELRSSSQYGDVPVLLVCDSQPPRGIRELLGSLGVPLIEKPFDLSAFCRAVEGLLPVRERAVGA